MTQMNMAQQKTAETPEALTLLAALTFAQPVDAEVLAALDAVMVATRQESGCVDYAAHVHAEDARRVVFYERWQNQAAFEAHSASAHLAAFRAVVGPRLAGAPELTFWKRLG